MNCKNCNSEIQDGVKYCEKCGNKVNENIEINNPTSSEKLSKESRGVILSVIVFIIAFVGFRYLTQKGISNSSNTTSKQEIIHDAVKIAKDGETFPQELDESTTFTNISEQTGAIRYEYILHDIDESKISNLTLKNILTPLVCQNPSTKSILDKDINLEYSYQVKNSITTYFLSLDKSDCL